MKNKTIILTKTLLKNGEGFGISTAKNKASKVLFIILAAAIVPAIAIMVSLFVISVYNVMAGIGQEGMIISIGIAANSIIIFIFGIFYIISSFYFSSDIETLLPLPLKPRQIVGAKFLSVAVYEYLITAAIFIPIVIIFGVKGGLGPVYYIYGAAVYAFIPIVPLASAAVIVMILMRFTNISKHKDAFKLAAGIFALIFSLGINVVIQRFSMNAAMGNMEELLMRGENSLAVITSGVFPTAGWAVTAMLSPMTMSGLLNFLLYIAVSALVFIVLLYLGELLYFKGVIGMSESGSRRNKDKLQLTTKEFKRNPVLWTYTMNELRLLFRTPIYFLNCVLLNFIWPVLLLFPLLTQGMDKSLLDDASKFITNPEYASIILLGALSLLLFFGGSNATASTAISREGQELFVKKYIPVSYKTQITAKVLSAFIMGMCAVVMLLIFAVGLFRLPLYLGLLILATGWMAILLTCFAGILIDLYNPKLNWDSEHKAVKQNLNVIYSMVFAVAIAGLTIFAALRLSPGLLQALFGVIVVYGGLNGLMYYLVYKKGVQRFQEL